MLDCGKLERGIVEVADTESLVTKEHLLQKINRLYEMVKSLHSEANRCPSMDPVVLFKRVLLQHM